MPELLVLAFFSIFLYINTPELLVPAFFYFFIYIYDKARAVRASLSPARLKPGFSRLSLARTELSQDFLWLSSFQAWLGADLQAEPSLTVARLEPAHVEHYTHLKILKSELKPKPSLKKKKRSVSNALRLKKTPK